MNSFAGKKFLRRARIDTPTTSMKGQDMTRFKLTACLMLLTLLSASPAAIAADYYKMDAEHTSVIFSTAHAGLSYTYGMFRTTSGDYQIDKTNPANCRFRMLIQADSLDTNNAERDKHLRGPDFFDVQQFPDITFESTRCELTNTQDGGVVYKLVGNLSV